MVGFVLGVTRLILAFVYRAPECNLPDDRPGFIKNIHYMYVATALFWITGIIAVVVSLLTSPPKKDQIRTTTFWALKNKTIKERTIKDNPYKECERRSLPITETNIKQALPNGKSEDHIKNIQNEDVNLLMTYKDDSNPLSSLSVSEAETPVDCYSNGQAALMGQNPTDGVNEDQSRCSKFMDWFCGYKSSPSHKKTIKEEEEDEAACLKMLEEKPAIQRILNTGLVCVCSIGVFMFIYFSL